MQALKLKSGLQKGVMFVPAVDLFHVKHPRLRKTFSRVESIFLETGTIPYEYRKVARNYEKIEQDLLKNPREALAAEMFAQVPISKTQERKLRSAAFLDARQSPRKTLFDDIRLEVSTVAALAGSAALFMAVKTLSEPLSWYFLGTIGLAHALVVAVVLVTESLEKRLNNKDMLAFQAANTKQMVK